MHLRRALLPLLSKLFLKRSLFSYTEMTSIWAGKPNIFLAEFTQNSAVFLKSSRLSKLGGGV